jgi:hypothetical protein
MQKTQSKPNESFLQTQRQRFTFLQERIRKTTAALLNLGAFQPIKKQLESMVFDRMSKNIESQMLQHGQRKSNLAFCIVHWNAPDFLFHNIKQLEYLYPDCNIFVLDNGSSQKYLHDVRIMLREYENITLFSAKLKPWSFIKILGLDNLFLSYTHSKGLQFLLNYSAKQEISTSVFLDQDCILNRRIDSLINKLNKDIWVVGARDYVFIPRSYGALKKGELRYADNMIHASFMILRPMQIRKMFGKLALVEETSVIKSYQRSHGKPFQVVEPYYGISIKTMGRILFLEPRMDDEIPLLTSYSNGGTIYAWHAWFSSRVSELTKKQTLDGLPVDWLLDTRNKTLEFMKHLNESNLKTPTA